MLLCAFDCEPSVYTFGKNEWEWGKENDEARQQKRLQTENGWHITNKKLHMIDSAFDRWHHFVNITALKQFQCYDPFHHKQRKIHSMSSFG